MVSKSRNRRNSAGKGSDVDRTEAWKRLYEPAFRGRDLALPEDKKPGVIDDSWYFQQSGFKDAQRDRMIVTVQNEKSRQYIAHKFFKPEEALLIVYAQEVHQDYDSIDTYKSKYGKDIKTIDAGERMQLGDWMVYTDKGVQYGT